MAFEDEYKGRQKKKDPLKAFLPAIGLLLALAFAAIAFFLREPVQQLLIDQNVLTEPVDEKVGYVIGGVIFLVLMLFAGFIFALFAPKPAKRVTESELKKEREAMQREAQERKERRRKMQKQAFQERKDRIDKK